MLQFIKRIVCDLTGRPTDPESPPVIDWKKLKTNEDFIIALTKLKSSIENTRDWFKKEIRPRDDFRIILCHPDFAVWPVSGTGGPGNQSAPKNKPQQPQERTGDKWQRD